MMSKLNQMKAAIAYLDEMNAMYQGYREYHNEGSSYLREMLPVVEAAYDLTYGTGESFDALRQKLFDVVQTAFPVDAETLEDVDK